MGETQLSFASTKERNTTKVSSCSMFVQTLAVHSSDSLFPVTHTHTRQQLLADGMEGIQTRVYSLPTRNLQNLPDLQDPEVRRSHSQTSGLYFTSPIFFASVSYINSRHILTMKTSASSSRTIATSSRIP